MLGGKEAVRASGLIGVRLNPLGGVGVEVASLDAPSKEDAEEVTEVLPRLGREGRNLGVLSLGGVRVGLKPILDARGLDGRQRFAPEVFTKEADLASATVIDDDASDSLRM